MWEKKLNREARLVEERERTPVVKDKLAIALQKTLLYLEKMGLSGDRMKSFVYTGVFVVGQAPDDEERLARAVVSLCWMRAGGHLRSTERMIVEEQRSVTVVELKAGPVPNSARSVETDYGPAWRY